MKVSNLYIGNIEIVSKRTTIDRRGIFVEIYNVITTVERTTVLEYKNKDKREVTDIIYGGKYRLDMRPGSEIGEEFASILYPITQSDIFCNYKRKNISKMKVKKLYSEN